MVMAADTLCGGDGCSHDMWWWLQTRYKMMAADTICGDGCRHDMWWGLVVAADRMCGDSSRQNVCMGMEAGMRFRTADRM